MPLRALMQRIRDHFIGYDPLIEVRISRSALLYNLKTYCDAYPSLTFAPVLKSNAYGHGLVPVARILKNEHVAFFVLDSLYEAKILRSNGINTPLLIIGYTSVPNMIRSKLPRIAFTITSIEQLRELGIHTQRDVTIHLKIDTGMHRQGLLPTEIEESIGIIRAHPHLHVEGVCSHFADADNRDQDFTRKQIEVWESVVKTCKLSLPQVTLYHIAATAGTHFTNTITGNVARLGLGLYGINPSPHTSITLKPVLRMETVISSVRHIEKGASIGYNHTHTLTKSSSIATIPAGYYEGVDRRLSNAGYVYVKQTLCPIVGRVSMNITSIDVSNVSHCLNGDIVTLISNTPADENSVASIARRIDTIPWDVLVHIPQHLKRTVID